MTWESSDFPELPMGPFGSDFGGILLSSFPSAIAEPGPALVIVVLWGLCVFLESMFFPPF